MVVATSLGGLETPMVDDIHTNDKITAAYVLTLAEPEGWAEFSHGIHRLACHSQVVPLCLSRPIWVGDSRVDLSRHAICRM